MQLRVSTMYGHLQVNIQS